MKGFGLIEVLIATFIFSCGLLGIMLLQHDAWSNTLDAYYSTLAINQLSNIQEQFAAYAADCALWKAQNKKLFPQAKVECNSRVVSLCWQSRKYKISCVNADLVATDAC